MNAKKPHVDYAVVYIALRHFDMMPKGRIANHSDYAALPDDVRPLCVGNGGFAALDKMRDYLAVR